MKKKIMLFICIGVVLALKGQITIQYTGTLKELLSVLDKDYGYSFLYSNEEINDKQQVSINLSGDIENLFDELKKQTNIIYEVKNKSIILKSKKEKNMMPEQNNPETIINQSIQNEVEKQKLNRVITDEKILWKKIPTHAADFRLTETSMIIPSKDLRLSIREEVKPTGTESEEQKTQVKDKSIQHKNEWNLLLHSNLLYDLALIPNLGIELKLNNSLGFIINASWGHINWDNNNRKYRLWSVGGEIRYYAFAKKNFYVGGMFQAGELNYKFSDTGKQGNFISGGVTTGYTIDISRNLQLDLGIGFGYNYFDYERYKRIENVNVRDGVGKENKWFPTRASVTLIWQIK